MTSTRVGIRLATSVLTSALLAAAMWHPQMLPRPAQRGLAHAVNGAARFCLWVWDQPADALDDPAAEWNAVPKGWTAIPESRTPLARNSVREPVA